MNSGKGGAPMAKKVIDPAKDMLGSRIAGGNTAYFRNKSDYYPTPPEVTQALLNFLNLRPGTKVWEPACGDGHMV